jgi:hypothetical protein
MKHIRRSNICPLCRAYKSPGLLACWPCFGEFRMADPSPLVDDVLWNVEQSLKISQEASNVLL